MRQRVLRGRWLPQHLQTKLFRGPASCAFARLFCPRLTCWPSSRAPGAHGEVLAWPANPGVFLSGQVVHKRGPQSRISQCRVQVRFLVPLPLSGTCCCLEFILGFIAELCFLTQFWYSMCNQQFEPLFPDGILRTCGFILLNGPRTSMDCFATATLVVQYALLTPIGGTENVDALLLCYRTPPRTRSNTTTKRRQGTSA